VVRVALAEVVVGEVEGVGAVAEEVEVEASPFF
jgi:hypothetical protein